MKGHRDLNQSLKKLLVFRRRRAPDIFEGFVSVEELCVVEETDSVSEYLVGIHASFLHTVRPQQRIGLARSQFTKVRIESETRRL